MNYLVFTKLLAATLEDHFYLVCFSFLVGISIKIIYVNSAYRLKGTFHINYMTKSKEYFNNTNEKKSTDELFSLFFMKIFNELLLCISHCVLTTCLFKSLLKLPATTPGPSNQPLPNFPASSFSPSHAFLTGTL